MKYKVIAPTSSDLGEIVVGDTLYQKYRQGPSMGGWEGGIIWGCNTNLGAKWWVKKMDLSGRYVVFPLNSKEYTGERAFPPFITRASFYKWPIR